MEICNVFAPLLSKYTENVSHIEMFKLLSVLVSFSYGLLL